MAWLARMRERLGVGTVEGAWRLALVALMLAYAWLAGGLALHRHHSLETQALDMGYADQVAWNTSWGRPFRFTAFVGEAGTHFGREFGHELALGRGADLESLLAFHVELIYLPLGLLYRVLPGPETLIVLLTVVIALGAAPVYWIARRELRHPSAAFAFGAMYLSMPAIQGATLSDFHPVSMAGPLLLLAILFLLQRRTVAYVATAVLCASLKEEVGLAVAMTGAYACLAQRRRRLGGFVFIAALAWVALCVGVIIPYHAAGSASPFLPRYGGALRHIAGFPESVLRGSPVWPLPEHAMRYAAHMLVSSGALALLAPFELAVAAPLLVVNALSASNWQHGGGAHYSSEVAGPLLFASIVGARRAARLLNRGLRRLGLRGSAAWQGAVAARATAVVAAASLGIALTQTVAEGVLPPSPRFTWPQRDVRLAHLQVLLARIPKDAVVSAQSNLFSHVSHRPRVYTFPTVDDAEYILLDIVGVSGPLDPDALHDRVQKLLSDEQFEVLEARDGLLLLARGHGRTGQNEEHAGTPAFLAFTRAHPDERMSPARAKFGDRIELVGYRITPLPAVNLSERRADVVLFFRARDGIQSAFRLVPFLVSASGSVKRHDIGNSAQLWYPTSRWAPGEVVSVRYPPVAYVRGERLAVGVANDEVLLSVEGATQTGSAPSGVRVVGVPGVVEVAPLP